MSNLSVNTITDASGGSTASINGLTPQASNMQPHNLIINGAMTVAQRGTSFSVDGTFAKTLDRYTVADGSAGSFTVDQSTDTPDNFKNSLKITVASADTSIAAGDYAWLQYIIEGNDCAYLSLGQSSAQTYTLSFWIKSSVTGTFSGGFENWDGGRGYAFTYAITSANTWEYKTVTVAGDTGGGNWKTDNLAGLFIYWDLGTGTDRTAAAAGSWSAARSIGVDGSTKLVSTNAATFYLTGVQLEAGSTASSFAHENYSDTLRKCQRYYWQNTNAYSYYAYQYSTGNKFMPIFYPVEMRTTPTSTVVYNTGSFTVFNADNLQWKAYVGSAYNDAQPYYTTSVKFDAEL